MVNLVEQLFPFTDVSIPVADLIAAESTGAVLLDPVVEGAADS